MTTITTNIDFAINDLKQSKPVAIPTETVYGLAASVNNEEGIRAVFNMKNRPIDHPLIVHVAKQWDLKKWVDSIPDYAQDLMNEFWPGPLTLVFKLKAQALNPLITGGQETVAIRCPKHPMTQELLNRIGEPLVAPSANPFGKVSPTTASHVQKSFCDNNLLILNGGRCKVGIESTIVDASKEDSYVILRHGIISSSELKNISSKLSQSADEKIKVSGALKTHYQPDKPLYYFHRMNDIEKLLNDNHQQIFIICSKKPDSLRDDHYANFPEDPEEAAYILYYALRQADLSSASVILIQMPQDSSRWKGIIERIEKAGRLYNGQTASSLQSQGQQ